MKTALKLYLFLFAFLTIDDSSFSLDNYQIKKICQKQKRELTCIKILREKKSTLQKGNKIEIPVIPYKR